MITSKYIRVQLTEKEERTLRAAAKICNELMDALGMAIIDYDNYDIDLEEIRDNLLHIALADNFEYDEKEEK